MAKLNANMQAINVCVCLALGSGTSTDPETFTLRTLESLDHGAVLEAGAPNRRISDAVKSARIGV